jgi:restriction system protein
MSLWVVRAGRHGEQQEVALAKGLVCHGWNELPDYSHCETKEQLRHMYEKVLPQEEGMKVSNAVGQLWRFAKEIKEGDLVALPLKKESAIAVGEVKGPYRYEEVGPGVLHIRPVKWLKTVPRSTFTPGTLHAMGSLLTIFRVSEAGEKEVRAVLAGQTPASGSVPGPGPEPGPEPVERPDIAQLADDEVLKFIEERFKGHGMARLVDAVLQAQGYKTNMSPPGPDGGVDILAGAGLLGFDHPRLCVQVKSSASAAGQTVFNELLGVMSKYKAEQGLFVSWGGFTDAVIKDAKKEHFSIRLWDQGDLVEAILANYERLDEEIRAELPLKRIWVLVREEEG